MFELDGFNFLEEAQVLEVEIEVFEVEAVGGEVAELGNHELAVVQHVLVVSVALQRRLVHALQVQNQQLVLVVDQRAQSKTPVAHGLSDFAVGPLALPSAVVTQHSHNHVLDLNLRIRRLQQKLQSQLVLLQAFTLTLLLYLQSLRFRVYYQVHRYY